MNRRDYLLAGATLGTAGLAGCSFLAAAEAPPPDVPTAQLNDGGWTQTAQSSETVFDRSYGPVSVEAVSSTVQYVDEQLQERVADRTLDQVQTALSVFFATRVDFSPNLDNLPAGVGREELLAEVKTNARDSFEQQMEAQGLTDSRNPARGLRSRHRRDSCDGGAVRRVPIRGDLLRRDRGRVRRDTSQRHRHLGDVRRLAPRRLRAISGGAYPVQNFEQVVETDLSDGITSPSMSTSDSSPKPIGPKSGTSSLASSNATERLKTRRLPYSGAASSGDATPRRRFVGVLVTKRTVVEDAAALRDPRGW